MMREGALCGLWRLEPHSRNTGRISIEELAMATITHVDSGKACSAFGRLVGKWKQTKAEALAEKLEAQGFNWMMRKMFAVVSPTLSYTLKGTSLAVTMNLGLGIEVPGADITIGAKEPVVIHALGRIMEAWLSIDDDGNPRAENHVYLTEQAFNERKPSYTSHDSWVFDASDKTLAAVNITKIDGKPDTCSRILMTRIGGEPLIASS